MRTNIGLLFGQFGMRMNRQFYWTSQICFFSRPSLLGDGLQLQNSYSRSAPRPLPLMETDVIPEGRLSVTRLLMAIWWP